MSKANKIILNGQTIEVGSNSDVEIMYRDEQHLTVKHNTDTYVLGTMEKIIKPATPTFSKAGGTYDGGQSLTISCATSGATIQYKVGSGNWVTGTSVSLNQDTAQESKEYIITARASKNGEVSDEATATYTIFRKLANPTITASGDQYNLSRIITIGGGTSGATHNYKIGSDAYQEGDTFTLSATSTIYAKDTKAQWKDSNEVSSSITVGTKLMYIGLVDNAPTDFAGLDALTHIKQTSLPYSMANAFVSTEQKKVCFAYNSSLADLRSIKDANGTEYIDNFTKTTISGYKIYTMNSKADQSGMKYNFNS